MINHAVYRKSVVLKNGKQVMIRLPNGQDRNGLVKFFERANASDVRFCKENLKDLRIIDQCLSQESSRKTIFLVAAEVPTNQILASLNLHKGQEAASNVGEIQHILVERPCQSLGLGSKLLDELIELAAAESLHWLKVELATELKNVVKAFQSKGFKIRATLEDYFRDERGITYDAALMMRRLVNEDEEVF